jgi:hypothetical protein
LSGAKFGTFAMSPTLGLIAPVLGRPFKNFRFLVPKIPGTLISRWKTSKPELGLSRFFNSTAGILENWKHRITACFIQSKTQFLYKHQKLFFALKISKICSNGEQFH